MKENLRNSRNKKLRLRPRFVPPRALIICIPAEKYRRRGYIPWGLKHLPKNFIVDYSDKFIASRCYCEIARARARLFVLSSRARVELVDPCIYRIWHLKESLKGHTSWKNPRGTTRGRVLKIVRGTENVDGELSSENVRQRDAWDLSFRSGNRCSGTYRSLETLAQSSASPPSRPDAHKCRRSDAGTHRIPVSRSAFPLINLSLRGDERFKNDTRGFVRHVAAVAVVVDIRVRRSDKVIMIGEDRDEEKNYIYIIYIFNPSILSACIVSQHEGEEKLFIYT